MAGRATPPASCLASAEHSESSRPRQRPRFARIRSASASTHASASTAQAARSDESLTSTLKSLTLTDGAKDPEFIDRGPIAGGDVRAPARPAVGPPASPTRQSYLEETPGRRRSKPIDIEASKRQQPAVAYTPLSARGDLPGGYFPNHEKLSRQYKTHPFCKKKDSTPSAPIMSSASSTLSSPPGTAPQAAQSMVSPTPSNILSPEALAIPMGKYHPSTYKPVSPGMSTDLSPMPASIQPVELRIQSPDKSNKRSTYERRTGDVKLKLQQYQREMVAQAKLAELPSRAQDQAGSAKPTSPKLQPLGSPGPITPLELEESSGYMAAGMREANRDRLDQERSMKIRGSGSGSPVLSV